MTSSHWSHPLYRCADGLTMQIVELYVQQLPLRALRFLLLHHVNQLSISYYMWCITCVCMDVDVKFNLWRVRWPLERELWHMAELSNLQDVSVTAWRCCSRCWFCLHSSLLVNFTESVASVSGFISFFSLTLEHVRSMSNLESLCRHDFTEVNWQQEPKARLKLWPLSAWTFATVQQAYL